MKILMLCEILYEMLHGMLVLSSYEMFCGMLYESLYETHIEL